MNKTIQASLCQDKKVLITNMAERGAQGIPGEAATIQVGTVTTGNAGTDASVVNSGTENAAIFDFVIPRGDKGETGETGQTGATGNGIASFAKTSTSGLVDTYTITFTNGSITTLDVTNGKGISSITKTSMSGLVDTYTITYNDNTTSTFTVTNGANGANGQDGYSPTATVVKSGDVTTITITDKNGTTTAQVLDGGANIALSNLSTDGNARLHALKGYADAGELLTDAEGLADVKKYAHSTFDLSKFTKVGSPTVSADGITSGLSSANYFQTSAINFSNASSFEVLSPIFSISEAPTSTVTIFGYNGGTGNPLLYVNIQGTTLDMKLAFAAWTDYIGNTVTITTGKNYQVKYIFTGTQYEFYYREVGSDWVSVMTPVSRTDVPQINSVFNVGYRLANGTLDLKELYVKIDGVTVFSGNKTGSDSYTINGSTVTVPYTLSKTGSKIVDSAYRTQVTTVYNEFGYAPYYTLSDTDFTLPMGELYGMITRASDGSQCMPSDTSIDLTLGASGSTYTAPANGYFAISKVANGNSQVVMLQNTGSDGSMTTFGKNVLSRGFGDANFSCMAFCPAKKGDIVNVTYNAGGNLEGFSFIYAQGSESEAQ